VIGGTADAEGPKPAEGPPSTAGFGSQGWLFSPVRGCGLPGQNRVTPGGDAE
jgi:hypothetical protein